MQSIGPISKQLAASSELRATKKIRSRKTALRDVANIPESAVVLDDQHTRATTNVDNTALKYMIPSLMSLLSEPTEVNSLTERLEKDF